jgi:para-aminobenzoate synthetase / 4-amino-4-deoxychorismate lyase
VRVSLTPNPNRGVFETLLVLDGNPIELEAHLERLNASLAELFATELPNGAREAIVEGARPLRHGKLRLTVAPSAGALEAVAVATEMEPGQIFPGPEHGVTLRSVLVDGGLGPHKWADRRLLERTAADAAGDLPLVVDGGGAALEAARGSLFSGDRDWLVTPPLDGRILPSIARQRALEFARAEGIEVREQSLLPQDLRRHGAFLAGSVRGIEPVCALDGVELPPPGEVSARIAAGLRGRWLPAREAEPVAVVAGGRRGGRPVR